MPIYTDWLKKLKTFQTPTQFISFNKYIYIYIYICGIIVIVVGNDIMIQVQILDKAVCISPCSNTFGEK